VEDWTCITQSYETRINRIGLYGQEYVWKKAREPFGDRQVKGTVKFGGGSMMVWSGMECRLLLRLREGWIVSSM
jgi:hypothetical protein